MSAQIRQNQLVLRGLVFAVFAWGLMFAIGAYRHNPARAVVILACVAGFLGFWELMMALRSRRLASKGTDGAPQLTEPPQGAP